MAKPKSVVQLLTKAFPEDVLRDFASEHHLGVTEQDSLQTVARAIVDESNGLFAAIALSKFESEQQRHDLATSTRRLRRQILKWAGNRRSLKAIGVPVSILLFVLGFFGWNQFHGLFDVLKIDVQSALKQSEESKKRSDDSEAYSRRLANDIKVSADAAISRANDNVAASQKAVIKFSEDNFRELEAVAKLHVEMLMTEVDSLMLSFDTDRKTDFGPARKALKLASVLLQYESALVDRQLARGRRDLNDATNALFATPLMQQTAIEANHEQELKRSKGAVEGISKLLGILERLAKLRQPKPKSAGQFLPDWRELAATAEGFRLVDDMSSFNSGFDTPGSDSDRFASRANAFKHVVIGMAKEKEYQTGKKSDRTLAEAAQLNYQKAVDLHSGIQWLATFNLGHAESSLAEIDPGTKESILWLDKARQAAEEALKFADETRRLSRSYNNIADSNYKIAWALYATKLRSDRAAQIQESGLDIVVWLKTLAGSGRLAVPNSLKQDTAPAAVHVEARDIDQYLREADKAIGQSIEVEDASESTLHHATRAEILSVELVMEIDRLDPVRRQKGTHEVDNIDARFNEILRAFESSRKVTTLIYEKIQVRKSDVLPFHILIERLGSIRGLDSKKYEDRLLKAAGYE
jgi:hypothetical protein